MELVEHDVDSLEAKIVQMSVCCSTTRRENIVGLLH
jgi:hypothetical protein